MPVAGPAAAAARSPTKITGGAWSGPGGISG